MEKILLIEDDADIREMLIDYLSGDGYEITAYADGVSVGIFTDITDYSGRRLYQYAREFDYIEWLNE